MSYAEASVHIDAPAELVWRVMLDLSSYGLWNPFIRRIDAPGPPRVGDRITLYVRFRGGQKIASRERITTIEPPAEDGMATRALLEYEFYGRLHHTGLVRGRRSQLVEQQQGESTVYRTEERFHGPLAFALPLRAVQDGFRRHAEALKLRAESLVNS